MADLRSVKTSGRFDRRSDDAAQFLVFRDNSDRFRDNSVPRLSRYLGTSSSKIEDRPSPIAIT